MMNLYDSSFSIHILRTGRQTKSINNKERKLFHNENQNVERLQYLFLRALTKCRSTDIPRHYSRQDFLLPERRGLSSGTSRNEMILPGLCRWVGSSSTCRFDLIRRNFDATLKCIADTVFSMSTAFFFFLSLDCSPSLI